MSAWNRLEANRVWIAVCAICTFSACSVLSPSLRALRWSRVRQTRVDVGSRLCGVVQVESLEYYDNGHQNRLRSNREWNIKCIYRIKYLIQLNEPQLKSGLMIKTLDEQSFFSQPWGSWALLLAKKFRNFTSSILCWYLYRSDSFISF